MHNLEPSIKITSPSYMVTTIVKKNIRSLAKKLNNDLKGSMLDIGCGNNKKHYMFPSVSEYIGLDHQNSKHDLSKVDIIASAYEIPTPNNSFDTVICTAVLEHLEEPKKAIQEAYRVLKSGGYAIYTAPLFWHIHEAPRDFYRYTKFGLKYLFESTGYNIIEIKALSGFWVTFGSEFSYYIRRFRRRPFSYFIDVIIVFNNWLFPKLDKGIFRNENFTWMYLVVARKP